MDSRPQPTLITLEPRAAVLVLASALPPYDGAIDAIRSTWAAEPVDGVDVWFVYGRDRPAHRGFAELDPPDAAEASPADARITAVDDVLVAGCADVIWDQPDCLLRKRLAAFAHLIALRRYDYLVTVCATSYLDVPVLGEFLAGLPRTGVYQGPVGVCEESGRAYVSGSCIIMSTDLAIELVSHTAAIVEENAGRYADDVALARWVAANLSDTDPDEIARRIHSHERPTGDNTFVHPPHRVLINYVSAPPIERQPVAGAFHYHFDRDRVTEMVDFHEAHFARVSVEA